MENKLCYAFLQVIFFISTTAKQCESNLWRQNTSFSLQYYSVPFSACFLKVAPWWRYHIYQTNQSHLVEESRTASKKCCFRNCWELGLGKFWEGQIKKMNTYQNYESKLFGLCNFSDSIQRGHEGEIS
jgi:hypothetical protein